MKQVLRIAILTTDARGAMGFPNDDLPNFGTAIRSLLEGFEMLGGYGETDKESLGKPRIRYQELGTVPPFEIHVISCTQQIMASPEKLASNIWFHSLHVPKAGWLRSGYLGCVLAVRKKLREIKPDLVHAQGTERDCAISAILSPYPKVLTIHGNLRLIKKQMGFKPFTAMWLQSYLEGLVVPLFDGVICITNYTRKAVEHEVPKTWVVPNAVEPSFLELGQQRFSDNSSRPSTLDSRPRCPVILCVANIDPRKNQNEFIKALDPLAKKISFEVRFFGGCGTSEYAHEFRKLVASRSWCHYGGMLGREELKTQFEQADMLALPTHEDNCPMVVLEAQAAGVPVIASNVGGVPDLVEDEVTGLLVNPENPETFCTAVEKLIINNAPFKEKLALSALQKAGAKYHPRIIAGKHLEIYKEIVTACATKNFIIINTLI